MSEPLLGFLTYMFWSQFAFHCLLFSLRFNRTKFIFFGKIDSPRGYEPLEVPKYLNFHALIPFTTTSKAQPLQVAN